MPKKTKEQLKAQAMLEIHIFLFRENIKAHRALSKRRKQMPKKNKKNKKINIAKELEGMSFEQLMRIQDALRRKLRK